IVASPQLAAREFLVDVEYRGRGALRYPGPFALTTSPDPEATRVGIRRPAPALGEHTAEVLAELGLESTEVTRLRAEGIVGRGSSRAPPSSSSAAARPGRSRRATSPTTAPP